METITTRSELKHIKEIKRILDAMHVENELYKSMSRSLNDLLVINDMQPDIEYLFPVDQAKAREFISITDPFAPSADVDNYEWFTAHENASITRTGEIVPVILRELGSANEAVGLSRSEEVYAFAEHALINELSIIQKH